MKIDRIIQYCLRYDINITTLEKTIGIARGSIKRWVNSEPSVDKVQKVANYFNCSVDYLLENTDNPLANKQPPKEYLKLYDAYMRLKSSDEASANALEHIIDKLLGVDEE